MMPTSPTESGGTSLVVFVDASGRPLRWVLHDSEGVVERGESAWPSPGAMRVTLAVPGEQVMLRWLDLNGALSPAQATAAARLQLADASAEPISELHVAVGRADREMSPVALVRRDRLEEWIAAAAAAELDPDAIVPTPLLIEPPSNGFARRMRGPVADFRGATEAFSVEPDLAEPVLGGAPVIPISEAEFEAGLAPILAAPPLNLLQGPFARRRQRRLERPRLRRLAWLAIVLAVLSLAVQIALILSYTFAADRLNRDAQAIGAPGRLSFGAAAGLLFAAVRATPGVEIAALDYRRDGSLAATLMIDNAAALAAIRSQIEAAGLAVETGELATTAGGRPAANLTVRGG